MKNKNEKKQHTQMTREEYLAQLKKYLRKLPHEDYENAMEYFTEYFDEVEPEGEADLIQELGTPKEAAYDLLDNLITEKKKEPGTPVWVIILITILALFAAPVGGSLAIGGIVVLLACVLVAVLCLLCIFLFGGAVVCIGAKFFLRGILSLTTSFAGSFLIAGMGLISLGIGILVIVGIFYLCKWLILVISRLIQKLGKKGGRTNG